MTPKVADTKVNKNNRLEIVAIKILSKLAN